MAADVVVLKSGTLGHWIEDSPGSNPAATQGSDSKMLVALPIVTYRTEA